MLKTRLFSTLGSIALVACWAQADTQTFDFKDAKGVNNIVFLLDAPLESINGTGSGISGTIEFDKDEPAETNGKIILTADSLMVPNPSMLSHMKGERWMNVSEHPEITFELDGLKEIKSEGNTIDATAEGSLTMRGVTHSIEIPVKLTYLPDMLAKRGGGVEGDLLVVRSTFTVKLTDYGIDLKGAEDKVANETQITLSLAGASPRK